MTEPDPTTTSLAPGSPHPAPSRAASRGRAGSRAGSEGGLSTTVKVILSVAVLAVLVGFFRYTARGHTSHYKMVDEVMVGYGAWVGKPIKVHGYVEPGSIVERVVDQETVRTFILEHKGKRIQVRNTGPKPDSFKDKSEVVADGTIVEENGEPILVATNLMAKCPSKYQGAPKDKLFD